MRAVVGCAVVSLLLLVSADRAEGRLPVPKFGEPTCEEQCRNEQARGAAACEDGSAVRQSVRDQCLETVDARLDVCLRICED
jgi:hypothetical protein